MQVYDLVVIGGGSAGLSAIGFGLELGASVALIERHRIGGDCTWTGCVPSKTLIKTARVVHDMRQAARYGVPSLEPDVDLAPVMAHVHAVRDAVYHEETPEAIRAKGADVYLGEATFVDPDTLAIDGRMLKARRVLLCTGAHPVLPPIEGLEAVSYLTSETVWDLRVLPRHLIVVGGGPIGCELGQSFRRLGSQVTIIATRRQLLPDDDPEAAETLARVFRQEGIDVRFHARATRAWQDQEGIHVIADGQEVLGDTLLVATGRQPNVDGLGLEKAGVSFTAEGIQVDRFLRTTQKHIYAAGDCVGMHQFTHYANWQAFMASRNALLPGLSKGTTERVPWTTFTDPEVAHVGMTEAQARERYGDAVSITLFPLSETDRGRTEGDTEGLIKLITRGTRLLGATVVAARAGEMIHEWGLLLANNLPVRNLSTTIHVYPTYARINLQAAGRMLQQQLLSGLAGRLARRLSRVALHLMRWQRGF